MLNSTKVTERPGTLRMAMKIFLFTTTKIIKFHRCSWYREIWRQGEIQKFEEKKVELQSECS